MPDKFARPRGTQDILPDESWKWQHLEDIMRQTVTLYGYRELRMPTFEHTEVFSRSVGETTDIVSKEMYTFTDKGDRSVTLRPEGTAGMVRAVLENGLLATSPLPLKNYYIQSCFRYEKAQKGRLREFHQLGIECFGTHEPAADVEAMAVAVSLWDAFGVADAITLEVNSIGCPSCRPTYHQALVAYFEARKDDLCDTCLERLDKNPMRILDCKNEQCAEIAADAPVMLDYLCDACAEHFDEVRRLLDARQIAYVLNPRIVRGLDYYTNTVFEFIADGVGTQGTVCAGGRYDGLIEQMGGQPTPAVGFGLGMERLLLLTEEKETLKEPPQGPLLYVVAADDAGRDLAGELVAALRAAGLYAEHDLSARSFRAQMKSANQLNAVYSVVLGSSEVKSGEVTLKHMQSAEEITLPLEQVAPILQEKEHRSTNA